MSTSLSHSIRRAYAWTTVGNATKNFAGFGISLVLAHLLGPQEFGLLSMAIVFTNILAMLQDCGIGQAVVYYQEEGKALDLYFTTAAALGAVLTVIAFVFAPWLAAFYKQPAVIPIIRVLSPTLFLGSLYSVAQGSLSRALNFRAIALIELISTVGAGLAGVVCALIGWGVWALVTNVVLSVTIQCVAVCWLVRPTFTARPDFAKLRRVFRWGMPLTAASLLWQGYENADYLVVGRVLGQEALGYYGLAFRTATLINSRFAAIITRVSFPAFSAVQNNLPKLLSHWYGIVEQLGLVIFPMSVMLAFSAHDFLLVALGPKWLPAETALQLLCVVGGLKCLVSTMTNCMHAVGRTDLSFRFSLTNAILLPLSFIAGCRLAGINGVAAAWCVVAPLTFFWFLVKTLRLVDGSVREYCRRLTPGILVSAACGAAMWLTGLPLREGLLRMALRGVVGGLVVLGGLWWHRPTRSLIERYSPFRFNQNKTAVAAEDSSAAR